MKEGLDGVNCSYITVMSVTAIRPSSEKYIPIPQRASFNAIPFKEQYWLKGIYI